MPSSFVLITAFPTRPMLLRRKNSTAAIPNVPETPPTTPFSTIPITAALFPFVFFGVSVGVDVVFVVFPRFPVII